MQKRLIAVLLSILMLLMLLPAAAAEEDATEQPEPIGTAEPVSDPNPELAGNPQPRGTNKRQSRSANGEYFALVTDAAQLNNGDHIAIVSDNEEYYMALGENLDSVLVTISENAFHAPDETAILTLSAVTGGWQLAVDGGYLSVNGSELIVSNDQATATVWTISIQSDAATVSCGSGDLIYSDEGGDWHYSCGSGGSDVCIYIETAEQDTFPFGDGLYWHFENNTLTITGEGSMDDYTNNQPWADVMSEIQTIVLPEGLTNIGANAFYNCTALTTVEGGGNVASIGANAFNGCTSLMDFTIPDSVLHIAKSAILNTGWWNAQADNSKISKDSILFGYKGTMSSQMVAVPNGTRVIADEAYKDCTGITKVTNKDSVLTIGDSAFNGCTALETLTMGSGVTYIGANAFSSCAKLKSVTIPDGVRMLNRGTFYRCTALESITLPCDIDYGTYHAFTECEAIQSIHFTFGATGVMTDFVALGSYGTSEQPHNSTQLQPWSYAQPEEMTVTLDEGITHIGKYGLSMRRLKAVTLPSTVTSIGDHALAGTEISQIVIPDGVVEIANGTFVSCASLTTVTLPQGLTVIDDGAFSSSGLEEITIPKSVKTIGILTTNGGNSTGAFSNCKALQTVTFEEGSEMETLGDETFLGCSALETVTFTGAWQTLGLEVFRNCTALKSVTLSAGLKEIPLRMFMNCTALESIVIPSGVETIGAGAFQDCVALTTVTIPHSMKTIGGSAFGGATALTDVFYYGDYMYDITFYDTNECLTEATWHYICAEISNSHKLYLSEEIGVQFKVSLPDELATDDCYMEFTYSDGRNSATQKLGEPDENGYYWFTAYVNALELNDEITATFHYGDDQTAVNRYRVMYYINLARETLSSDTKLMALIDALQNYGYYLQESGWKDGLEHNRIPSYTTVIDESNLANISEADYAIQKPEAEGTTITFSLTLNSKTRINVFSEFEGKKYTYHVGGIGPAGLGKMIDIEVATSEGTKTVRVCPISYAYAVINNDSMSVAKKAAMTAYYNYYLAAASYRGEE